MFTQASLTEAITSNEKLIDFLEKNKLTKFANKLRSDPTSFVYTHVQWVFIDYKIIAEIAEALKYNNTITSLYFSESIIQCEGAKAIAEVLKCNNTITSLHLKGCEIRNTGAIAIANALEINNSITQLDLCDNRIDISGAKALAETLKINHSITRFDIGGSKNKKTLETELIIKKCLLINSLKADVTKITTDYLNTDRQQEINQIVSKIQPLKNSTNISQEQNNKIEQIFESMKVYKIPSKKLKDINAKVDMLLQEANEVNSTSTIVLIAKEVIYDKSLLNHPKLLQVAVDSKLSSDLIQEAINNNDEELILAGLISVGYDVTTIN
nr:hypothetical protein [Rickettsia endosymbiont of Ceutorhynchus assimilis]